MAIPKVAAIHDLSGLGKCSLTAAIPILAVCGVQAVPMPTAVLSNQTAFESYTGADLSIYMPMIAEEWKKRRAEFQGIFTGYLSSEQEVKWVEGFIDEFRKEDTLILVDPVLGDEGKFYRGFGDEMCCAMRNLCKKADVITPNLTEALFLLGKDAALAEQGEPLEIVEQYAKELSKLGPSTVIITGIHQGENIWNVGFDAVNKECFSVSTRKIGEGYSGTGDILSSVVCGCMVRGESAHQALEKAAKLLEASIAEAVEDGTDPNEGIAFEHHLKLLMD
ncbi:pyridoxamine kinase [uncultured Negativibacillus sp.]|uniref:pyridoxamine kinase n=1 Tax=uncultured Negativibacillus sp. TaxID=1980696 RepID=UPI0025CEFF35|nr:pyridoxamine kinase [uncultured Negativibacillus sp.]